MDIFEASKKFPLEEKFSLTDQIRRYSRSVCVNLAEGYRKRRYPAHFVSKLSDAETENAETQVWLDLRKIVSIWPKNYMKSLHLQIMKLEKCYGA
jgi:four helix bundle protein